MSIKYNGKLIAGKYKAQIIPSADTVNEGKIKIATQLEVDEGTSNNSAVTPLYLSKKQDKLTVGDGIIIENNVISSVVTSLEWGSIEGDIKSQKDLLSALNKKEDVISDLGTIRHNSELVNTKQDKLTAGKNIKISSENVISATIDLTYDEKNYRMVFGG